MIVHIKKIHIYRTALVLCIIQMIFFSTHIFSGEEIVATPTQDMLEKPIFKEREQGSVQIQPTFNNKTTNIAFYIKCPSVSCMNYGTQESPIFHFSAENIGHGHAAFSNYWAPPDSSEYVAVEYVNDQQQFTCSDLSLEECIADSHFVSKFHFKIVDDNAVITEAAIDSIAKENSQNKEQLAEKENIIAESITSDLADGETVTASIDGVVDVVPEIIPTSDVPVSFTGTTSEIISEPISTPEVTVPETITDPLPIVTPQTDSQPTEQTVEPAIETDKIITTTF